MTSTSLVESARHEIGAVRRGLRTGSREQRILEHAWDSANKAALAFAADDTEQGVKWLAAARRQTVTALTLEKDYGRADRLAIAVGLMQQAYQANLTLG
ncbi:MAG: hypothetical protein MUF33_02175 [Candidatus Nanopelagicales bacterium]|jgi:histone H3/H4|nr:hypothetical protein [Candidatus Nanopelagicales bacterium]